jgi:hypothetical protein
MRASTAASTVAVTVVSTMGSGGTREDTASGLTRSHHGGCQLRRMHGAVVVLAIRLLSSCEGPATVRRALRGEEAASVRELVTLFAGFSEPTIEVLCTSSYRMT